MLMAIRSSIKEGTDMENNQLGAVRGMINPTVKKPEIRKFKRLKRYKYLLLMLLPGIIYYIVFKYVPIYGIIIAFKDFRLMLGALASPWAGLKYFRLIFNSADVWHVMANTLIISGLKLMINFPAPIILALLLNEVRGNIFKRTIQTISYLPHFLSWVVLGGMVILFLSPSTGPVNILLQTFGLKPVHFIANIHWFRPVLIITSLWKDIGWGTIVYLAALSNTNPELYEASRIDGASRLKQTRHITLPAIMPIIAIMFIFAAGAIVNDDFDQIFNLYNPLVYRVGDVFSTYIYRIGLEQAQYSFATAAGLLKNVTAFILIITVNTIVRKLSEYSIW